MSELSEKSSFKKGKCEMMPVLNSDLCAKSQEEGYDKCLGCPCASIIKKRRKRTARTYTE